MTVVGIPFPAHGRTPHLQRPYATVVAQVDTSGHVTSVRLDESSGNAGFDAAGLKAMQLWSFMPAANGCKAVAGSAEYAVSYGAETFGDPCRHDTTVTQAPTPEYPPEAQMRGYSTVEVDIAASIDPVGRLLKTEVTKSSGNAAMDAASVQAAVQSTYLPAVVNCTPVSGTYDFKVTFDPNS
jgi:TonB family protein